jgi:hypothetical protein
MSHPYPTHFFIYSSCCLACSHSRALTHLRINSCHPFPHSLTNDRFSLILVLSRFQARPARSPEDSSPAGQAPGLRLTGQMGRHDPLWAVSRSWITHESMLEADLIASKARPIMQVDVPGTAQPMTYLHNTAPRPKP